MRQKTIITKLLQSVTEVYYKVRQVLQSVADCYYQVRQVLQSVTDCHYKVRQVLQSLTGCYHKVCQVLQSATVITKWDVTHSHVLVSFFFIASEAELGYCHQSLSNEFGLTILGNSEFFRHFWNC